MHTFRRAAALILILLLLSATFPVSAHDNPFVSPRGSADSIDGTTVLVAIFVNDPVHSWNYDDPDDFSSYSLCYYRLKNACEWLTKQAGRYGARPQFFWDWYNLDDLYYVFHADRYLGDLENAYKDLRTFVFDRIDLNKIRNEYRADNIIFIAYYNQDFSDQTGGNAWKWDFDSRAGEDYALEIIWITDQNRDWVTVTAAGMAHEIMHCFGAPDLYRASDQIPQAYVDHLRSIGSRDIMYTIDYSSPDSIGEVFSELDAYYLGLVRWCDDVAKYGLAYSSFDQ